MEAIRYTIPIGALRWLLEQGGASVRYQAMRRFASDAPAAEISAARERLSDSSDIRRLLDMLAEAARNPSFNRIHGAPAGCLENALPMLLDRGMDNTFPALDDILRPSLERFMDTLYDDGHCFYRFRQIIAVPFLLWAGYRDAPLLDCYYERLERVSAFARRMDFDIYGEQSGYKGIPKSFRDRRVIRPELYEGGVITFPLIYDLYAYRARYAEAGGEERERIRGVLRYVMDDAYQQFQRGYGLLRNGPSHYYAMGWDALLPTGGDLDAAALHRMELLAAFPDTAASPWFTRRIATLKAYMDGDGVFDLPKDALRENNHCWVLAGHMALGENRRAKASLRLEGTLRAWRMLYALNDHTVIAEA